MHVMLPAATLCHCSAAQVQLVVLCNHWGKAALLHLACAAPQAAPLAELGLAWVEEFHMHVMLPAATLCHCSAAQVQLVVLCNHWGKAALLHLACAAPQAAPLAELGLAWVEEFKLPLSLCVS